MGGGVEPSVCALESPLDVCVWSQSLRRVWGGIALFAVARECAFAGVVLGVDCLLAASPVTVDVASESLEDDGTDWPVL